MSTNFRLSAPFEMRGKWWLPEHPENQVPGTLKYTPDEGLVLELDGHLQASSKTQAFHFPFVDHEIVLGTSNAGTYCTLFKTVGRGLSLKSSNEIVHTGIYAAEFAFIGQHYTTPSAMVFGDVDISFTNFTNWVNKHPFSTKSSANQSKHVVEYEAPDDISFSLHSEMASLYVQIVHKLILNGSNSTSFLMKYRPHLRLSTSTPIQYQKYHSIILHILKLLSFLVGESVYVKSIVTKHPQSGDRVSIIYNQKHADYKNNIPHYKMILLLSDIQDNLQHVMIEWFNQYYLLKPTIDLFLGLVSLPRIYLEFKFLALVQAIESYHRAVMNGKYMDDSSWMDLVPVIEAAIPSNLEQSHIDSLKGKIKYGNEYSLRKRLREVIEQIDQPIRKMLQIYGKKETTLYIDKIVNTRNYYTHYSGSRKDIIPPHMLSGEVFRLWVLVYVIIAKRLGIPADILVSRLRARYD